MRKIPPVGSIARLEKYAAIAGLLMCLMMPNSAQALRDADYKAFMKTSPAFAAAEARLKSAWDTAKNVLTEMEFAALQKYQKDWIASGRDALAKQLMEKQAKSRPEAYAEVIANRAKLIEEYNRPERRAPQSVTGVLAAAGSSVPPSLIVDEAEAPFGLLGDATSWKTIKDGCEFGDTCKITGVRDIFDNFIAVTDARRVEKKESAGSDTGAAASGGQPGVPSVAASPQAAQGQNAEKSRTAQGQKTDMARLNTAELQKLAQQGNAEAQVWVAWMYAAGRGVPRNRPKALEWLQKAAKQGDEFAKRQLDLYEGPADVRYDVPIPDIAELHTLADQGNAEAQVALGRLYLHGLVFPPYFGRALEWVQKAVDQGHAEAQNTLAYMYKYGLGVPQDTRKELEWRRKAAEQGHTFALLALGEAYRDGKGVPKDERKALELMQKAAEHGDVGGIAALKELGRMYAEGIGVAKDEDKALEWYRKAAAQGDKDANKIVARLAAQREGWDCSAFKKVKEEVPSTSKRIGRPARKMYAIAFHVPHESVDKVILDDEFEIFDWRSERAIANIKAGRTSATYVKSDLQGVTEISLSLKSIPQKVSLVQPNGKVCSFAPDRSRIY